MDPIPLFRAGWRVAETDELLVVEKPALVSELPREGEPADLSARVRAFTGRALATVPQLERRASGLVAFAKHAAATKKLDRALSTARRTYLVAVNGRPKDGRLTAKIAYRGKDTRVDPRGERAAIDLRVRARRGDRALVEARIVEGKPAQLRTQLEHAAIPIAGDERRAPAHRLYAQLAAIDLGELGAFEAAPDPELSAWVDGVVPLDLLLERAIDRRALVAGDGTACFRLVHGSADGVPGIEIDRFGDHAVVHFHPESALAAEAEVLDALERHHPRGIYVKRHRKTQRDLAAADLGELAPAAPIRGTPAPSTTRENGIDYDVALGDGLSVGLFLDQRENRARVRAWSKGASVLNLFAYTGAFSVAAAAGGAARTVTVDASAPALERARAQLARFGPAHEIVRADVFDYLAQSLDRFDLVIVDPPTFSTTKSSRWSAKTGWVELLRAVLAVAERRVLVTTNDRRMTFEALERDARDAVRTRSVSIVRHLPPPDFPPLPDRGFHLKTLEIELRR
jgi:23S rRNA (cytosine1962-C5)-methyltransferase